MYCTVASVELWRAAAVGSDTSDTWSNIAKVAAYTKFPPHAPLAVMPQGHKTLFPAMAGSTTLGLLAKGHLRRSSEVP